MKIEEVYENLCYYDIRNPNGFMSDKDDLDIPPSDEVCYCSNCFYKRTKLANYIIEIYEKMGL